MEAQCLYWCRAGHVHAYERNYQTLNYNMNGCSPRWITMGDSLAGIYETCRCRFGTASSERCCTGNHCVLVRPLLYTRLPAPVP